MVFQAAFCQGFTTMMAMSETMEQLEFFAIPSPCIGVCEVNNKGYCKGCLRNRNERLYWQSMSDVQKRVVMRLLADRRRKIAARAWMQNESVEETQRSQSLDF